jgi:hypothetical protein
MQNTELLASETTLLGALAELLMLAGQDCAADAIYAAMEAEAVAPSRRPVLKMIHSVEDLNVKKITSPPLREICQATARKMCADRAAPLIAGAF